MHVIIGPGAVGGTLAVHLARAARPVALCARSPLRSLTGEGPAQTTTHVLPVYLDPLELPDLQPTTVMLTVKAHQTASAAPWIRALTARGTPLLVVQNGIEHAERVQPHAHPSTPIIPVMVDCPSSRSSPGHVRWRRRPRLRVGAGPLGEMAVASLAGVDLDVAVSEDFRRDLWAKLTVNAVSGALPTLSDQPTGVFQRSDMASLAREIMLECLAVARAEGVTLDPAWVETVISGLQSGDPSRQPSMLQDRRAGRALEYDARNGAVVRLGARYGVATPLNQMLATLLAAI